MAPFHLDTNICTIGQMQLAGIPIRNEDVFKLAGLLRTGGFEEILALTVADRESILRALDEPPTNGLAELRGVLLAEHEWRVREGLV